MQGPLLAETRWINLVRTCESLEHLSKDSVRPVVTGLCSHSPRSDPLQSALTCVP